MVANQQTDFTHDMQGRVEQQIQRTCHHSFGAIFNGHHAEFGRTCAGRVKDIVKLIARNMLNAGAKKTQGRFFAERSCRA